MSTMIRIDKYLADTGKWSRKDARLLLKQGRVSVNGSVVRAADTKIDPITSKVVADDEELGWSQFHYYMLHKPAGVLTATEDKKQKTVLDLLPEELRKGVFPVGRLDKDTTGLLILTDDGDLAHQLLSPKHHVDKVYFATIEGTVNEEDIALFKSGMVLGDGERCMPAELESIGPGRCKVILQEGKYHQVKRMLASVGKPVLTLHRHSMGHVVLDPSLDVGNYRQLTTEELKLLQEK